MRLLCLLSALCLAPVAAFAQPASPAVETALLAPRAGSTVAQTGDVRNANIRIELTITDTYTSTPATKTVTMLIANTENARVRTSNTLPNGFEVQLNVDASVQIQPGGEHIRATVTFEYTPAQIEIGGATPSANPNRTVPVRPAQLHESLTVVLADGQATLVSQSADPATDRKVSVELTATVVR